MKKIKVYVNIIILSIIILLLFGVINTKIYVNEYDNIDTYCNWLTSVTVKFTNNWLSEGALNLNFIMYENQDSIEYNGLQGRSPYISYPSGSILVPYAIAKILNIEQIDYIFIKYMVTVIFAIDCVLIGIICYLTLKKITSKSKFKGSLILSILLAVLWMILPVNSYYLRNIYFADQAVITIVLVFMILELKRDKIKETKSKAIKIIYDLIYYFTIIFGIITDYFFWFALFIAFCIKVIPIMLDKKTEKNQKIKNTIKVSLQYIIPLLIGISMFLLSIIRIENWQAILTNRFLERISFSANGKNSLITIVELIIGMYTIEGAILLLIGIIYTIAMCILAIIKNCKKQPNNDLNEFCKLAIFIFIPPIMQILFFQNHSAVHDFFAMKLGLPLVFTIIIIGDFLYKILEYTTNKKINFIWAFAIGIILSFTITTVSSRTNEYIEAYTFMHRNYELEYYLKENAKYEEVYISYTYEIPTNPPKQSSISGKNVHKVEKVSDIYEKFPNLDKNAKIILVVEKRRTKEVDHSYVKIRELDEFELYEVKTNDKT